MSPGANIYRRFAALALASCLLAAAVPPPAFAKVAPPRIGAPAATIKTRAGVPLWNRKPHQERRVASTIKLLNALVVRDRARMGESVRVSRKAANVAEGGVGLVAGQRVTVRQLLNMMLIASANDAAEALAIHIAGSEKAYVRLMNAKAKELGLKDTRAADPHGLSKRERSSADDLAVIARHVLADKELAKIVRKKSVRVPIKGGGSWTEGSTFRAMNGYRGLTGVKTGFTNPAGYCFVASAKRGDVELVAVVLGTGSNAERFGQARRLLDWGFKNTHSRQLITKETTMSVVPTGYGRLPIVVVHPSKTVKMALLDGSPKVTRTIETPSPVRLPVFRGQRVGTLELRQGNRTLTRVPLLVAEDVAAPPPPPIKAGPAAVVGSGANEERPQSILQTLYSGVLQFTSRL
ncbi:MAG: D-alanyl-D-alanine carboxypeptidase [Coriobacteriales bacterium]|nr:D-alanyl-D-alanine carboxypeptidase [Coriobacteriales bacterium]